MEGKNLNILDYTDEPLDVKVAAEWNRQTIEKFMQSWLRHKPESAGLKLSAEGWALMSDLVTAFGNLGYDLEKETIERIVRSDSKHKFEMEGDRIRARFGYSIDFETKPHPGMPPAVLYHSIPARFLQRVMDNGLKPVKRQFVHLAPERKDAKELSGRTKSPSIMLKIAAHEAHNAGVVFYPRGKGIWLSEAIPSEFIMVYHSPENPKPEMGEESGSAKKSGCAELRSRRKGMGFLKKPRKYDR